MHIQLDALRYPILAALLKDTMIGYRVHEMSTLQNLFAKEFAEYNPVKIEEPHATIAVIQNAVEEEDLLDLLEDAAHYGVTFTAVGLEYFAGRENLDYLVLKLKPSPSFFDLQRHLNESYDVRKPPAGAGGFKAHVSIMTVPKGNEDAIKAKIKGMSFPTVTIKPQSVALWGADKKVSKEVPIDLG